MPSLQKQLSEVTADKTSSAGYKCLHDTARLPYDRLT